ncbi:MAG TPA: ubiquinol oxidase subunit II [Candidatus Saccharimonadales bacterium]|nr:ubiquinol oxidase subunit II [Candidatus Saccharimonadales bacterium]
MKKRLNKSYKGGLIALVLLGAMFIAIAYLRGKNFAVLNPKGLVALKERNLMIVTVALGLLVVIPVYIMLFSFAWKYREGNTKAKYSPELTGNRWIETIWWGIPIIIIGFLGVITWNSSHDLDPRKSLGVSGQPLNVEVIALQWRWLFIYPEQGVASLNYLELPVNRPVNFDITSDAPMNSFWIPQLGSQIYAMPGMQTRLNLIANKAGTYDGSSANLSGDGFANMRFTAAADSPLAFNTWLESAKSSPLALSMGSYKQLAQPSEKRTAYLYSSVDPELFDHVLLKYMVPGIN